MIGNRPLLHAGSPDRPAGGDVVFCSTVRFGRDVSGCPFAEGFTPRMRLSLTNRVGAALGKDFARIRWTGAGTPAGRFLRTSGWLDAESEERRAAVFKAERNDCAVLVGGGRAVGIVATRGGDDLRGALARASEVDDRIASAVPYAFWPAAGYLAPSPEDVGLGFSAEATLHLAATAELLDAETWEGTLAAAEKLGFEAEAGPAGGAWSAGRPSGFVKFSAIPAEGESEEDVIARLEGLVRELVRRETGLREHLLRDREARAVWSERVKRTEALALAAERSDAEETFTWLAALRYPAILGMPRVDRAALDRCLLEYQPFVCRDDPAPPEEWAARLRMPLEAGKTARKPFRAKRKQTGSAKKRANPKKGEGA